MPPTYFSDHFRIAYQPDMEWFDPILGEDTKLFIDPFEIYADDDPHWQSAHSRVIDHFQAALELLAPALSSPNSPRHRIVQDMMMFPEPVHFGFGYVGKGQNGAGGGKGLALQMLQAMSIALRHGWEDINHFEELTILVPRIGPDRISDMTCNMLGDYFVRYTEGICKELGIQTESRTIEHCYYDLTRKKWVSRTADLPINPFTDGPILLAPKRFLDRLPELNPDDWFDTNSDLLRAKYNLDVRDRLSANGIVTAARENPDLVRAWSAGKSASSAVPYDVDADPEGLHNWLAAPRGYVEDHPLKLDIASNQDLMLFIGECVQSFKHFVEEEGGWRLLYNDDNRKPKHEESIQLLFKGIVQNHCKARGVRVDREVQLGRGPVDFVFTQTCRVRALLEVKKMSNSRYWDGLEQQLLSYLESDETDHGWFVAVRFSDSAAEELRDHTLKERTKELAKLTGLALQAESVDGRSVTSASKV